MKNLKGYVKAQERILDSFGVTPIGTSVVVTLDNGKDLTTRTRSEPWMLAGHTAVILIEQIAGCYALERVRKVSP